MPHPIDDRVRAAWRAHACAAGLCVGAQLFALGTGVAQPVCLNAAWLAALPALALLPLVALRARQTLAARQIRPRRALCLLLSLTLLADALFLLSALAQLAHRALSPQSRTLFTLSLSLIAVACCAACGRTAAARVAFALRYALPALLLLLCAVALSRSPLIGLFPLLGRSGMPTSFAALCLLSAVVPALSLLLTPPELVGRPDCAVPGSGFFAVRLLAGGLCGIALLLALTLCSTFESLALQSDWGQRMRVVCPLKSGETLASTLLSLLQTAALALSAANQLACAAQAAARAFGLKAPADDAPRAGFLPLAACTALLALTAFGFSAFGAGLPRCLAPLLVVPAAAVLLLIGRRGL